MKYTNTSTEQLDKEIEKMFELSMPNSAFKRVIPAHVKEELRTQYVEYLSEQKQTNEFTEESVNNSRSVSTQVIKVNISALKEAGYCCCEKQLAEACEALIREQKLARNHSEVSEMKNLTENVQTVGKNNSSETTDGEMDCDTETTNSKLDECSSSSPRLLEVSKPRKAFPAKLEETQEFKNKQKSKNQSRTTKRKYFTKYMSNEFSKDTEPVNMAMMDNKTQELFRERDFNELVSEITGIN